ncbi:hypothetical protein EsH8_II_000842 [Colletotrichum jinshuiense]
MDTISNQTIVNGEEPVQQTAAEIMAAKRRQEERIQSFLKDKDGPKPLFNLPQTTSSGDQPPHTGRPV